MTEFFAHLPPWAGTLPQWATLGAVVIAVIQIIPKWRQQSIDKEASEIKGYREDAAELRREVAEVRGDLKKCEEECAEEMRKLHNELWGMRKQNIAEQISLINIILNSVDAPELKAMLKVLESVRTALNTRASVDALTDAEGRTNDR